MAHPSNIMELIVLFTYLVVPHFFFNLALAQNSLQPLCDEAESLALLSFRDSFLISKSASANPSAYPKVKSWNASSENDDCCSWDGVECDRETGHAIGLDLSSSCLYGSISSDSQFLFDNLSHLRRLNLADNDFNFSQIPAGIGQLAKLTYLNLSGSTFSGQIPFEILQLSNLSSLDLSLNTDPFSGKKLLKLTTPFLKSLAQKLSSLAHLDLSFVDIDSAVPENFANLSSLTFLDLTDSSLHGEFPIQIFNLPNLQFVNVRFNKELSGRLPEFHSEMPLKSLRLGGTIFSGELPSSIGKLQSLTELRIRGSNFSGSVPSSIGNLTELTYLDLANNSFSGHIPSSLQNLTRLQFFQLSYNGFRGRTLPWIGKLRNLTLLDLVRTNLEGEIPSSYANLTQLSTLSLAYNQLTGSVPIWLANMTQLTDLYLSRNNLTGTVDLDPFVNHEKLYVLRLSFNKLTLFSKSNSNNATALREMRFLDLAFCNLKRFPEFLNSKNKLEWLDLSYNNIIGTMPKIESQWSKIEAIYLRFNMLRGSLPVPPPTTTVYMASNNQFSGEISPSICNLRSLFAIDLSFNNLSGELPPCMANFSDSLSILKLRNNNFQGSVPNSCSTEGSRSVSLIDLSSNRLEGPIPTSLSNCKMLEYFHVGDNLIRDTFPFWLGTLPNLNVLILRANKFYGSISATEGDSDWFSELRIVDLSYNHFSGSLPSKYFQSWNSMKIEDKSKLKYMQENKTFGVERYAVNRNFDFSITLTNKGVQTTYEKIQELFTAIDLSSNRFEGRIPELIGDLKGLRLLNLSNNNFVGEIPTSLGELSKLEALDLSQNELSGEIPRRLAELNFLSFFDVSDNNLSGNIPRGGQFDTFPESSFDGNSGLSVNENRPSPPSARDNDDDDADDESLFEMVEWKMVGVGYGIGLAVAIVISHFVCTEKFDWVFNSLGMRRLQMLMQRGRRN